MVHYTYILQSTREAAKRYIGHTSDLKRRVREHNAGKCPATRDHRPWKVAVFIAFETLEQAIHFECYLKTGSGHAFANRHFWRANARAKARLR